MPIIAELLHIQAVFVDEVRLVDSAGTVNAKALGYIYGLGKGTFVAKRRGRPPERKPLANVKSWAAFKEYALTLDPNRYVFRGQESSAWRLRTFFHRSAAPTFSSS
jgi:hypothetical protein